MTHMKMKMIFMLVLVPILASCNLENVKKSVQNLDLNSVKALTGKFSQKDEVEMGSVMISSLLGAAPLVNDPALQRYVNNVGYWVAQKSKRPNLPWTFGVIDNEHVNAFAAPGGYILITKGLLSYLQSEAELAAVIAHEITHVQNKHHLDILKKSSRLNFAAGWLGNDSAAVDKVVGATKTLYARGLDKKAEFDADSRSLALLVKSGYDPYAMLDMLTTLESINPKSSSLSLITKTHPSFSSRISNLDQRIDGLIPLGYIGKRLESRFIQYKKRL